MATENKIIKNIYKTEDEIQDAIAVLGNKISSDFDDELILIPIMDGGLPFAIDLSKRITNDLSFEFIKSSSYIEDKKMTDPVIKYKPSKNIKDKDIIIIDDLIDTGSTIEKVIEELLLMSPKSISIATIFVKENRKKTGLKEYYCWERKDDEFLIGYGLDWNGLYRNLPYVATIKKEEDNG